MNVIAAQLAYHRRHPSSRINRTDNTDDPRDELIASITRITLQTGRPVD